MKELFSRAWIMLQYLYYQELLKSTPRVALGSRHNRPIVRVNYKDNNVYRRKEFSLNTPKGQKYYQIAQERDTALAFIRSHDNELSAEEKQLISSLKIVLLNKALDGKFYKSIKECSNPMVNSSNYKYKNYRMRSRAEVVVAECLDKLGLKYKYEPAVQLGSEIIYPDFVVYIESLDYCFFIEYLGKMNDYDYTHKTVIRINNYTDSGVYPYESILYLYGSKDYMPSPEFITNQIIIMLNSIAVHSLKAKIA